eukprot:COSAG06_NODE_2139_length_7500_cov_3.787867_8_plen_37_part_00
MFNSTTNIVVSHPLVLFPNWSLERRSEQEVKSNLIV